MSELLQNAGQLQHCTRGGKVLAACTLTKEEVQKVAEEKGCAVALVLVEVTQRSAKAPCFWRGCLFRSAVKDATGRDDELCMRALLVAGGVGLSLQEVDRRLEDWANGPAGVALRATARCAMARTPCCMEMALAGALRPVQVFGAREATTERIPCWYQVHTCLFDDGSSSGSSGAATMRPALVFLQATPAAPMPAATSRWLAPTPMPRPIPIPMPTNTTNTTNTTDLGFWPVTSTMRSSIVADAANLGSLPPALPPVLAVDGAACCVTVVQFPAGLVLFQNLMSRQYAGNLVGKNLGTTMVRQLLGGSSCPDVSQDPLDAMFLALAARKEFETIVQVPAILRDLELAAPEPPTDLAVISTATAANTAPQSQRPNCNLTELLLTASEQGALETLNTEDRTLLEALTRQELMTDPWETTGGGGRTAAEARQGGARRSVSLLHMDTAAGGSAWSPSGALAVALNRPVLSISRVQLCEAARQGGSGGVGGDGVQQPVKDIPRSLSVNGGSGGGVHPTCRQMSRVPELSVGFGGGRSRLAVANGSDVTKSGGSVKDRSRAAGGKDWSQGHGSKLSELAEWLLDEALGGAAGQQGPGHGTGSGQGQRQEGRKDGGGQEDTAQVLPGGGMSAPPLLPSSSPPLQEQPQQCEKVPPPLQLQQGEKVQAPPQLQQQPQEQQEDLLPALGQPESTANSLSPVNAVGVSGVSGRSARLSNMHARPSCKIEDVCRGAVYSKGARFSQIAMLPVGKLLPFINNFDASLGAGHPGSSVLSSAACTSAWGPATTATCSTDNSMTTMQSHAVQLLLSNGRVAAAPAAADPATTSPGSGDGAGRACDSAHTHPKSEGAASGPQPTAAASSTEPGGSSGLGAAFPSSSVAAAVAVATKVPSAGASVAQAAVGAGHSYTEPLTRNPGAAAALLAPPDEGASGPECTASKTSGGGAGPCPPPLLGEDLPGLATAAATFSNGPPAAAAAAPPRPPPGALLQWCVPEPDQAAAVQATSQTGLPDRHQGRVDPDLGERSKGLRATIFARGSSRCSIADPFARGSSRCSVADPFARGSSRCSVPDSFARGSSRCSVPDPFARGSSRCSVPDSCDLTLATFTLVRPASLNFGRDDGRSAADTAPDLLVVPRLSEESEHEEEPREPLNQLGVHVVAAAAADTTGEPAAATATPMAPHGRAAASSLAGNLRSAVATPTLTRFAVPAQPCTASGVSDCLEVPVALAPSPASASAAATDSAAAGVSCRRVPEETASAVTVIGAVAADLQSDSSERSSPAIATAAVLAENTDDADGAPCSGPSSAQLLLLSTAMYDISETEAVADSAAGFLSGPSREGPGRPPGVGVASCFAVNDLSCRAGPTARSGSAAAPMSLQQPQQKHQGHPQQQGKGMMEQQGQQTAHSTLSVGRHVTPRAHERNVAVTHGAHGWSGNAPTALSSFTRKVSRYGDDDGSAGGRLVAHFGGSSTNSSTTYGSTSMFMAAALASMAQLRSRIWHGGSGGAAAAATPVVAPPPRAGPAAAAASRGSLRNMSSTGMCRMLEVSKEFDSQRELPSGSGWQPGRARQRSSRSIRSQTTGRRLSQLLNSLSQTQAYAQVQHSESSRSMPYPRTGTAAFLGVAQAADGGSSGIVRQTTDLGQRDSASTVAGKAAALSRASVVRLSSAGLARPSGMAAASLPRLWHKVAVRVVASHPVAVTATTTTATTGLVQTELKPDVSGGGNATAATGGGGVQRPTSEAAPPVDLPELNLNSVIGEAMVGLSAERALTVTVTQIDVTEQVEAQAKLARLLEQEHKVLEGIFPRHVIEYMTLQGGARQAGSPSPIGSGRHASSLLMLCPGGLERMASLATWHPGVTILFADCVGFTSMCHAATPLAVMAFLNQLYSRFDAMIDIYKVYKVETIGDCYMVAGGLVAYDDDGYKSVISGQEDPLHAVRVMEFAKAMLRASREVCMPHTGQPVQMRIGLHSGPVTSGVVGDRMPRFCLFGDTVNVASRMESTCRPGHIHVSAETQSRLPSEAWRDCGLTAIKGKGEMQTYEWAGDGKAAVDDGQLQRIIGLYL